jgi:hypothetical protein
MIGRRSGASGGRIACRDAGICNTTVGSQRLQAQHLRCTGCSWHMQMECTYIHTYTDGGTEVFWVAESSTY